VRTRRELVAAACAAALLRTAGMARAGRAPRRPGVGTELTLRFTDLEGRQVDLRARRGKVVLVSFWASWCAPCRAELRALKAIQRAHGAAVAILGISLDRRKEELRYVLDREGIDWSQHFDGRGTENELAVRFGVEELPTLWLVDKKGVLRDLEAAEGLPEKVAALIAA
jgi:thiol-disulfide isomerase/thioredoxin